MKYLLATLVLSASLSAQIVRVANNSPVPFIGWKRTTIDAMPALSIGRLGNTVYVVGRQVGSDTHVVDVRVALSPGQQLTLDLAQAALRARGLTA